MATLTQNFLLTAYANRCVAVAAASADPAYPAANLLLSRLSDRTRSPLGVVTGWTIDLQLQNAAHSAAPTDVDGVQLVGLYLVTDTLQVRYQLSTGVGATGTVLADSGTVAAWDTSYNLPVDPTPPWGRSAAWFPGATVSGASYLRVTLTDSANTGSQLELSKVFAGPMIQPALINGVAGGIKDDWRMEDKMDGNPGVEQVLKVHRLTFPMLTEQEAAQQLALFRKLRLTGRLFVVPRPLSPAGWLTENVYCVVKSYTWSVVPKLAGRRVVQVTFEEVTD